MSAITSSVVSSTASIISSPTADPYHLGLNPQLEQYRSIVREQIGGTITPLNIVLLIALLTVTYYRFLKPYNASAQTLNIAKDAPIVFQTFTPRILLKYDGTKNNLNSDGKVYLAVKGQVHDVTAGRNFYGPGGPYENFAGRDATRGLACQSFDEEMLTKDLDGPLDDCSDLGPEQLENLQVSIPLDHKFADRLIRKDRAGLTASMRSTWLWASLLRSTKINRTEREEYAGLSNDLMLDADSSVPLHFPSLLASLF